MKPNYPLDHTAKKTILSLIEKCQALKLANVSFSHYDDEIDFYISQYKKHWELIVKQTRPEIRIDVYKIDDEIIYLCSAMLGMPSDRKDVNSNGSRRSNYRGAVLSQYRDRGGLRPTGYRRYVAGVVSERLH